MRADLLVRIIGAGRAGRALALALEQVGVPAVSILRRGDEVLHAAKGVDLLFLCVPDDAIAPLVPRIAPSETTLVVHLAGSLDSEVLAPHPRRASMHPLTMLRGDRIGAERLLSAITFALSGDPAIAEVVSLLGGRAVSIDRADRPRYHATACIAANHLTGLLGEVERLAQSIEMELDDFISLARCALDDAVELGPVSSLTGPIARGDAGTIRHHLEALEDGERACYRAGATLVATMLDATGALAGRLDLTVAG